MAKRRFSLESGIELLENRLCLATNILASLPDADRTLSSRPQNLIQAAKYTYFDARSDTTFPDCTDCGIGISGREIYRTDGTADGTVSILGRPGRLDAAQVIGDRIIFLSGDTLYSSFGTQSSTHVLMKIPQGQAESNLFPLSLIRGGERILGKVLLVTRASDETITNIFATDGDTVEQIDLPFHNTRPQLLGVLGRSQVWFLDNGLLWSVNRAGGVEQLVVKNLRGSAPMLENIRPLAHVVDGSVDRLFFEATTPRSEGTSPTSGLWRLNGSRRGVTSDITFVAPVSGIWDQLVIGDWLYFAAQSDSRAGLWRVPITGIGAELIFEAAPGSANAHPEFLTEFGDKLLFSAGGVLYSHDPGGGPVGLTTEAVRNFDGDPTSFGPRWLTAWNDRVYFVADDGQGEELWSTDGTTEGTRLVADIAPGPLSSSPNWLTPAGDELRFTASTTAHGEELWAVDRSGTTRLVRDVRPTKQPLDRSVSELTKFNDAIYFRLNDGVHGVELWRSDGTELGTHLVKDIYAGPSSGSPRDLFVLGDWMYFAANDGRHGYELWRTDGTNGGTSMVTDIWPGSEHSAPTGFTEVDGELWFAANDGSAGEELWKSDGTSEGTTLQSEINEPGLSMSDIIMVNDRLYVLEGTDSPARLWQLGDQPLLVDQAVLSQAAIDDYLFYVSARDAAIRKTDGGPPVLLATFGEGQDPSKLLATLNGEIYYPNAGYVFRTKGPSDGVATALPILSEGNFAITASATHLFAWSPAVGTIWSLDPTGAVAVLKDDRSKAVLYGEADAEGLFFGLSDGNGNTEIWHSDGTIAGTRQIDQFENLVQPLQFQRLDDRLLFIAEDSQANETVWSIPLAPAGDLNGDLRLNAADIDALFVAASSGDDEERFDLNRDQQVDGEDVLFLVEEIAGSRLGDLDLNGRVDFADFLQLSANFQGSSVSYSAGDSNGDGKVNFEDFLVLLSNFGFDGRFA